MAIGSFSRAGTRLRLLAVTVVVLSGCGSSPASDPESAERGAVVTAGLGHVHGLGVNPADGSLYIASHLGVYRVTDGRVELIADRYQDTMGFAVVGPDNFLASGHPDLRESLPTSLGLIESTDAARTWTSLSLSGQADFHALEQATDRLYGYDGLSGSLMVTVDRRLWETRAVLEAADVAIDPGDPDHLAVTGPDGRLLVSIDGGISLAEIGDAPDLVLIDWVERGQVVGVTPGGRVFTAGDVVGPWREVSRLDGEPHALDAMPGRWHAATSAGVYVSVDDGQTWQPVLTSS